MAQRRRWHFLDNLRLLLASRCLGSFRKLPVLCRFVDVVKEREQTVLDLKLFLFLFRVDAFRCIFVAREAFLAVKLFLLIHVPLWQSFLLTSSCLILGLSSLLLQVLGLEEVALDLLVNIFKPIEVVQISLV